MPDWFYRTISQRFLFRCRADIARDIAIGVMGNLARLPGGKWLIDQMGHMRPDERLTVQFLGAEMQSRIGLGPWVDGRANALPAWTRFGFGYIEIGPIAKTALSTAGCISINTSRESIEIAKDHCELDIHAAITKLKELKQLAQPVIARVVLQHTSSSPHAIDDLIEGFRQLAPFATAISISLYGSFEYLATEQDIFAELFEKLHQIPNSSVPSVPWLLVVGSNDPYDAQIRLLHSAKLAGCSGVIIEGRTSTSTGAELGRDQFGSTRTRVLEIRSQFGPDFTIIAAGGIHVPNQAIELLDAGADLLQLDTGLIFTGPGLTKRINGAILHRQLAEKNTAPVQTTNLTTKDTVDQRLPRRSWFWQLLLGLGMLFGSLLAIAIAFTKVVLPYDESFVGMTANQLHSINPRLLHFLTHDRVSLAGVMLTVGVLFTSLAWFGTRRGKHWAQQTIFTGASVGFASFFFFLGYGYLDPFHAFVTAIMSQFMLLSLITDSSPVSVDQPCLENDRAWRLSLWGQLLAIVHGGLLMLAGTAFVIIGSTSVFVPEDLHYMGTTVQELVAANPKLVPLIAHDRATLGGMLIVSGLCFALPALWGYTRGSRWLWIANSIAGLCGYIPAIIVHYHVGYIDAHHLAPAYFGLNFFIIVQGLLFPYQWGLKTSDRCFRSAFQKSTDTGEPFPHSGK